LTAAPAILLYAGRHPAAEMARQALRSLKHEYAVFVEAEIERYKESVPRTAILKIADEAVSLLCARPQYELQELSLCDEVDRLIRARLGLPTYETWRRKRLKIIAEYQRPERWGLRPDAPLVREVRPVAEAHVLVSGSEVERAALYLAAHGCTVTALNPDEDIIERVVFAAAPAGLNSLVRTRVGRLGEWEPDVLLAAVVCAADSLGSLSLEQRQLAIAALQSATRDGGVHLFEALGSDHGLSVEELRLRYTGWSVNVEGHSGSARSFVARKNAA
jgi:hypothetical protein